MLWVGRSVVPNEITNGVLLPHLLKPTSEKSLIALDMNVRPIATVGIVDGKDAGDINGQENSSGQRLKPQRTNILAMSTLR